MEVNIVKEEAFTGYINPALKFDLKLKSNKFESLYGIDGLLIAEDGKILAQLTEFRGVKGGGTHYLGQMGARGSSKYRALQEGEQDISLLAILNKEALNYIDNVRDKNRKKNFVFDLRVVLKILNLTAELVPLFEVDPAKYGLSYQLRDIPPAEDERFLVYKYTSREPSRRSNQWIISGNGPLLLDVREEFHTLRREIAASEWVSEFAPKLGMGKFILSELSLPGLVEVDKEFAERLNKAIKALEEMERKIGEGEWDEVIEKSRPIYELLVNSKSEIESILQKHGHPQKAIDALKSGIGSFFNYSSKFVKARGEKGEPLPEIKAEKEDAHLIYALSVSLLNLLTQKIRKSY